jgi:hypothetical protein
MSTESPNDHAPRRHPWFWTLLAFIGLIVGADQLYRCVLGLQVKAEMNALRKDGYPVGAAELEASLPPIPDQQNAALRIMEAADHLAVGPDALSGDKWPGRGEELGPHERDVLQEMVTNNAPVLEVAHRAAQLKDSRFPIDYSLGPSIPLPHLLKIKQLCNVLRAEAALHSEQGRPELAVKSIADSVALARALDAEPILISQLVRIAALTISCSSLERVLTEHQLPEPELATLAQVFREARESSQRAFAGGYIGEICLGIYCYQARQAEVLKLIESEANGFSPARILLPLYRWTGLLDRDYLFYLRTMHRTLTVAAAPFPERLARAKQLAESENRELRRHRLLVFSRMLLPALQRATEKSAENEARLRCAEAALALERDRIRNAGRIPDRLANLAEPIPVDPIDGAPLRLRKLPTGYVIYSVGVDGIDDGGVERERTGNSGVRKLPLPRESAHKKPDQIWPVPPQRKGVDVTFTVER